MNKWVSEYFGQVERIEITASETFGSSGSYSESEQVTIRSRVLPGALAALPATSPRTGVYCYLNSPFFKEPITNRFFIPAHDIDRYAPRYDTSVPGFIPKPTHQLIPPKPSIAELEFIVSGKRPTITIENVPPGVPVELVELILQEIKQNAKGLLDQLIVRPVGK